MELRPNSLVISRYIFGYGRHHSFRICELLTETNSMVWKAQNRMEMNITPKHGRGWHFDNSSWPSSVDKKDILMTFDINGLGQRTKLCRHLDNWRKYERPI